MSLSVLVDVFAAAGPTARLAARPHGVAHVHLGPLTPSGRFAAAAGRTACRTRTRRLSILAPLSVRPDGTSCHRVCARCSARLAPVGRAEQVSLKSRDDWARVFAGLTIPQLTAAAVACGSVEESHQVGYITAVLYGQPKRHAQVLSPHDAAVRDLHLLIESGRKSLAAAARTPEDVADEQDRRTAALQLEQEIYRARRTDMAAVRLRERELNGEYVAPWERPKAG